jgi:hypothetical protein
MACRPPGVRARQNNRDCTWRRRSVRGCEFVRSAGGRKWRRERLLVFRRVERISTEASRARPTRYVRHTGHQSAGVTRNDSIPSPPLRDASPTMVEPPRPPATAKGYVVSFAAVLTEQKANETAAGISVNGVRPRVVQGQTGSTTIYRVVLGPYSSREEAERVGRDSRRPFWIYEESR